MKILTQLALAAVLLTSSLAAHAGWVSGYYRSSGSYVAPHYRSSYGSLGGSSSYSRPYVYRNPYAAYPSVSVNSYTRNSGTHVAPYVRTPANVTVSDNLRYRGYGTIRVPRY